MDLAARLLTCAAFCMLLTGCGSGPPPSYFLSHPPNTPSREHRHYPVARQGDLTAWLASDHVPPRGKWLFAPGDPAPRHPIVGIIRAKAMPVTTKHDGAFLVVSGYDGPLFDLWEGTEAYGQVYTGRAGWIPVHILQQESVNTWVKVPSPRKIGGWSGNPVVIGDPERPEAIAGAMWYRSNTQPWLGGTTSPRMLKKWLGRLRLADFVES